MTLSIRSRKKPPQVVCLTEESVETLYLLGLEKYILGISSFVKRPEKASLAHPKVSLFTSSSYDKIDKLSPDLILGHSDIQKDIAKDLIERGHNVYIANHRSLGGVLDYIYQLGLLFDQKDKVTALVGKYEKKVLNIQSEMSEYFKEQRPKVYFEEWDGPYFTAIQWVSELIEICGGDVLFKKLSRNTHLARDRAIEMDQVRALDPDVIIACWCGKRVKVDKIKSREGLVGTQAVLKDQVFDVPPEVFLQPGPALFETGLDMMVKLLKGLDFS